MAQQLTSEILNAALENLTTKRQQLDEQIKEIRRLLGNTADGAAQSSETPTRKRTMSAAGRRAIAAAQRRRWAVAKGAEEPEKPAAAPKPRRKLSAAGRRNIVAALKKRWAAKRSEAGTKTAAKKSPAKTTAKKATKSAPASSTE